MQVHPRMIVTAVFNLPHNASRSRFLPTSYPLPSATEYSKQVINTPGSRFPESCSVSPSSRLCNGEGLGVRRAYYIRYKVSLVTQSSTNLIPINFRRTGLSEYVAIHLVSVPLLFSQKSLKTSNEGYQRLNLYRSDQKAVMAMSVSRSATPSR